MVFSTNASNCRFVLNLLVERKEQPTINHRRLNCTGVAKKSTAIALAIAISLTFTQYCCRYLQYL